MSDLERELLALCDESDCSLSTPSTLEEERSEPDRAVHAFDDDGVDVDDAFGGGARVVASGRGSNPHLEEECEGEEEDMLYAAPPGYHAVKMANASACQLDATYLNSSSNNERYFPLYTDSRNDTGDGNRSMGAVTCDQEVFPEDEMASAEECGQEFEGLFISTDNLAANNALLLYLSQRCPRSNSEDGLSEHGSHTCGDLQDTASTEDIFSRIREYSHVHQVSSEDECDDDVNTTFLDVTYAKYMDTYLGREGEVCVPRTADTDRSGHEAGTVKSRKRNVSSHNTRMIQQSLGLLSLDSAKDGLGYSVPNNSATEVSLVSEGTVPLRKIILDQQLPLDVTKSQKAGLEARKRLLHQPKCFLCLQGDQYEVTVTSCQCRGALGRAHRTCLARGPERCGVCLAPNLWRRPGTRRLQQVTAWCSLVVVILQMLPRYRVPAIVAALLYQCYRGYRILFRRTA